MSEEPKEQARAARRPRPIPRASGPQGTRGGWIVLAVILAVFLGSRYLSTNQPQPLELSLTEFRQRVERSEIESVERVRVVDGARTYLRGKLRSVASNVEIEGERGSSFRLTEAGR